ncbi:MAG: nucleotide pyrophosphohydrolase [Candidatus Kaiserbacteria bacterium]|nr:nucleotide pyrophosphohydrolase [Candidatus Kaiserbacteria bacterium]
MKQVETAIKQYLDERDWNDLRPSDIAKSISIEAAELLELFQWSDKTIAQVKSDEALLEELKKELADVLIYALDMAVLLDLDTERIILDKLAAVREKYPAEAMKASRKQNNPDDAGGTLYLQIKKQHREGR